MLPIQPLDSVHHLPDTSVSGEIFCGDLSYKSTVTLLGLTENDFHASASKLELSLLATVPCCGQNEFK